jgi:hypothetical protein
MAVNKNEFPPTNLSKLTVHNANIDGHLLNIPKLVNTWKCIIFFLPIHFIHIVWKENTSPPRAKKKKIQCYKPWPESDVNLLSVPRAIWVCQNLLFFPRVICVCQKNGVYTKRTLWYLGQTLRNLMGIAFSRALWRFLLSHYVQTLLVLRRRVWVSWAKWKDSFRPSFSFPRYLKLRLLKLRQSWNFIIHKILCATTVRSGSAWLYFRRTTITPFV